jgi:hypothetical protein
MKCPAVRKSSTNPITLAQTMLEVPYTVCNMRLVVNSIANVLMPATKTVK